MYEHLGTYSRHLGMYSITMYYLCMCRYYHTASMYEAIGPGHLHTYL